MQSTTFARCLSILGGVGLIGVAGYVNMLHTPSFDMQIVVGARRRHRACCLVFFLDVADRPGLAALALVGVIAGELYGFVATWRPAVRPRSSPVGGRHEQSGVGAAQGSTRLRGLCCQTECASGPWPGCGGRGKG